MLVIYIMKVSLFFIKPINKGVEVEIGLYASLDSAGSVTVNKPPVTFWIQMLSAYIFGLHGWSVILPQVLAGVGSIWLIYLLIKPTSGLITARLLALVLTCTPIVAYVSRTNNIDSMLTEWITNSRESNSTLYEVTLGN